ncbi:hypothetical protein NKR19_g5053 [Coniochaeta hoffmannii]|uniref:Uncharacterized protein n=1 Tax=Coniochaeta hoffmannii TaxID=91930 RepID=A0AA38VU12_9PEZI|nr:hypothetical protein NKR19_g5053 [Coniochaeta hoffmannii]
MDNQTSPQAFAARRRIAIQNVDKLGIKYEELPQLPFWAPLMGSTYAAYKLEIADVVVNTSALLGRGLTPEERDVIAYLAAKRAVTQSFEPPLSLAAAIYLERRGRSTSKFPFYTPKPTSFDPSFFPSKRAPMLQGPMSLMAWNATRFGCYAFVAHFVGGIFFQSYATSVQTAAMLRDPRLADLRRGFADRRRGIKAPPGSQGSQPWQMPEDPSMKDAETPYGDASYAEESAPATATTETTADRTRDQVSPTTAPTAPYPRARGSYPPPRQQPAPAESSSASEEFTESSFFEDDDASPVAASARAERAASGSGASAWERLRQQAKSTPASQGSGSSTGAPRSRTWGQNTEQYTYSQEDRDKASAKDQAQKEFDAMLEKERRGESDSQSRRW